MPSEKTMETNDFGRFVAELRDWNKWTQQELGKRAGLSKKQISDIEVGKPGNWTVFHDKVERLAKAFELTETEKAVFYAKAGFVYPPKPEIVDKDSLRLFLSEIPYPTVVRTRLWDYVAFNRLHIVSWNYTDAILRKLDEEEFGANNLRLAFNKDFILQTSEKHALWYDEIIRTFRSVSFPYIHTKRYSQIMDGMKMKKYRLFQRFWTEMEFKEEVEDVNIYRPRNTQHVINNQNVGKLEFMSFRLTSIYIPRSLFIHAYVPVQSSEEKYRQIRDGVKLNDVYFFREHPFD